MIFIAVNRRSIPKRKMVGLEYYHNEMVMGFATLIENKDDNTGGHIRRSSKYAFLMDKSKVEEVYKNSASGVHTT